MNIKDKLRLLRQSTSLFMCRDLVVQSYNVEIDLQQSEAKRYSKKVIVDLHSQIMERLNFANLVHVNSETGIIQPIKEIGEVLEKTPTYFHIDATQGFGTLNDELRNTKYDMLSVTAHKLGGLTAEPS